MKIDLDMLEESERHDPVATAAHAIAEVARIRNDAKRLGWSEARLADLAGFLAPGEYVAMIGGDVMAIGYRASGGVSRYFQRRK